MSSRRRWTSRLLITAMLAGALGIASAPARAAQCVDGPGGWFGNTGGDWDYCSVGTIGSIKHRQTTSSAGASSRSIGWCSSIRIKYVVAGQWVTSSWAQFSYSPYKTADRVSYHDLDY